MKRLAFSDDMMRAIAAGKKTMTRRPIKNAGIVLAGDLQARPRFKGGDFVAATCAFHDHPMAWRWQQPENAHLPIWLSARIMPAALAPYTLKITEVWPERLGEIRPSDAVREGMVYFSPHICATEAFVQVWEKLYGKGSWKRDYNSWVWVIGFERCGF